MCLWREKERFGARENDQQKGGIYRLREGGLGRFLRGRKGTKSDYKYGGVRW